MMTMEVWREGLLDCLKEVSDRSYQERVWVRAEGTEFSSFVEATCGLYDDFFLPEFINKLQENKSDKKLVDTLIEFDKIFSSYQQFPLSIF